MIRRHVIVHGEVQGVVFRDSCRRRALDHGVRGWIRNRADGSVEAVFEGDDAAVTALCGWCESGPPAARVAGVEITPEPLGQETGFRIR